LTFGRFYSIRRLVVQRSVVRRFDIVPLFCAQKQNFPFLCRRFLPIILQNSTLDRIELTPGLS
jgi:hypothetical protein